MIYNKWIHIQLGDRSKSTMILYNLYIVYVISFIVDCMCVCVCVCACVRVCVYVYSSIMLHDVYVILKGSLIHYVHLWYSIFNTNQDDIHQLMIHLWYH